MCSAGASLIALSPRRPDGWWTWKSGGDCKAEWKRRDTETVQVMMWELLEGRLIERGRGLHASRLLTRANLMPHRLYRVWSMDRQRVNAKMASWSWGDHASLSRVSMPRLNWFFFILFCMGNFGERILSSSSWQEVPSRVALVRLDRKRLLVAARHTPCGVVWMEMPQLLGLSYQVILPSKRRRIKLSARSRVCE